MIIYCCAVVKPQSVSSCLHLSMRQPAMFFMWLSAVVTLAMRARAAEIFPEREKMYYFIDG